MRDYDTIIDELISAIKTTKTKVGSWQKDVLVLLLEAVLDIYMEKEKKRLKNIQICSSSAAEFLIMKGPAAYLYEGIR